MLLVAETFYSVVMICLKLSLGIFFLRIMVDQTQRRIIYFVVSLSAGFGAIYFFFIVFQCGAPIQGATFWERYISRQCVPDAAVLAMGYTHAIITALTDATFAVLPIGLVRRAKLHPRQKIVVGGILIIGAVYVYIYDLPYIKVQVILIEL
jgi:hypothetical protein